MYAFFLKMLDWVFPPHEDALRVKKMRNFEVLHAYAPQVIHGVHVLSSYKDHDIRALIHEAKFYGNRRAFELLGTLTAAFLDSYGKPIDVIIPIPLSSARMRARGFNQVCEILRTQKNSFILTEVLVRTRNTQPQTELHREERLKNVIGAFSVKNGAALTGKHVLLIDDVMTTGTTLETARDALLAHSPASVTRLAIAH